MTAYIKHWTPQMLRNYRKQCGWSQAVLAEKLGVSFSSVQNYERGTRREDNRPVEIPAYVQIILDLRIENEDLIYRFNREMREANK